jgi:pimeloyl-ACP methyl ester carboxylesterase
MPHSRVAEVDLYYELTDFTEPWRPGQPPVVLLHGLGGSTRFWLYQVPALAARFPVLSVDLRGNGQSSRPEGEWSIADMARDVMRLLRNLGAEKAHLVGLSLGGAVALQFALDYPYAAASLVLAGTCCGMPAGTEDMTAEALRFIEENPMVTVAARRITDALSNGADPSLSLHLTEQVAKTDHASYVRAARALTVFSARDRLSEIGVPTLVVVGDRDRVTPVELSEEIAARIRGARLVRIAGAGHLSNLERPAEFNRALLDFLPVRRLD